MCESGTFGTVQDDALDGVTTEASFLFFGARPILRMDCAIKFCINIPVKYF